MPTDNYNAYKYWEPWQEKATESKQVFEFIDSVYEDSRNIGAKYIAWRGQKNANYALNSSLYRLLKGNKTQDLPHEGDLRKAEELILKESKRWHLPIYGENVVSSLQNMAKLQHYGIKTRLIDISFNPLVALFFAVQKSKKHENINCRLFAIIVRTGFLNDEKPNWINNNDIPWPTYVKNKQLSDEERNELEHWRDNYYIYKPYSVDKRINIQNAGFLVGGVPVSTKSKNYPKSTITNSGFWKTDQIRIATSIAIRPYKKDYSKQVKANQVYSIEINASLKKEIREKLSAMYNYNMNSLYPDIYGLSSHLELEYDIIRRKAIDG